MVKVPNESAILEHSKNVHIDGVYLRFAEIQSFEVLQLHPKFLAKKQHQKWLGLLASQLALQNFSESPMLSNHSKELSANK